MMKRYIHNPAVFGTPGRQIKKALHDTGTPILDSFVRESIQNSLDAYDKASSNPAVTVEYSISNFNVKALTDNLEGLSVLNERKDLPNKYLSIRDRNTVGLTGDFNDESSNLKKLIFGFMNNQQSAGAGGSCGVGKTLYFRLGIGLVIYYSRVRTAYNKYESLLSAVLIEDPDSSRAIIPNVNGSNKFGIVIWGQPIPNNTEGVVQETRDSSVIDSVLDAFDFPRFGETETGTAIIIPFINEERLLANNRTIDDDRDTSTTEIYWHSSIEDYLEIAVQRWYTARLNNLDYKKLYPGGKALAVSINGQFIDPTRERSFSKLLKTLYKKAALSLAGVDTVDIKYNDYPIELSSIELNNIDNKEVGNIAYIRIPAQDLDSENIPFYEYIDKSVPRGTPVVAYCRKPGMVVSYETLRSDWTPQEKGDENEYLIGFFVLKSSAKLKKAEMTMEDYIRDCEESTHDSWKDKQIDAKYNPQPEPHKPPFVKRISEKVAKILGEAIVPNRPQFEEKARDITFGNLFGKIFLKNVIGKKGARPNEGVGSNGGNGGSSNITRSRRSTSASDEICYTDDGHVIINVHLNTNKNRPTKGCRVELHIQSATGGMSAAEWHSKVGTLLPFDIRDVQMTLRSFDGRKTSDANLVKVTKLHSNDGEVYGVELNFKDSDNHSFTCDLGLELHIRMRESKPSIYITDLD